MENKKIVKFISLLIIACLVFQLIPGITTNFDGSFSHTQNSKVMLSIGTFHTDNLLTGRENQKSPIQKVLIKNSLININQNFAINIKAIDFSIPEVSFDYRKVIRQSIPHYFNGSKYKNNHFAIY